MYIFSCFSHFSDEIIILSACGTAAKISFSIDPGGQGTQMLQTPSVTVSASTTTTSTDKPQTSDCERNKLMDKRLTVDIALANQMAQIKLSSAVDG